jgi:putative transcriptional regulator
MKDSRFKHAVILLAEATDEGALGFVINKSTDFTFADISEDIGLDVASSLEENAVFYGGPVSGERGWVLFEEDATVDTDDADTGIIEVGARLRVSPTIEILRQFLIRPECGDFRLLLGYAGWGPDQLEEEIIEGSWIPMEVDVDLILHTPESDVWSSALSKLGLSPGTFIMTGGGTA